MNNSAGTMTTHDLVLTAMCAAITCVLAPISIPLAGDIPISLCTFAVMLSGLLLGPRYGALSQLIYVLLGSVGLPVFAGWKGGFGIVMGLTGGYIIGYILMAFVTGVLYFRFGRDLRGPQKTAVMVLSMIAGTAVLYVFGTVWFIAQTGMTPEAALAACVIPFLPGDTVKIIAAAIIAHPIEAAVRHNSFDKLSPTKYTDIRTTTGPDGEAQEPRDDQEPTLL